MDSYIIWYSPVATSMHFWQRDYVNFSEAETAACFLLRKQFSLMKTNAATFGHIRKMGKPICFEENIENPKMHPLCLFSLWSVNVWGFEEKMWIIFCKNLHNNVSALLPRYFFGMEWLIKYQTANNTACCWYYRTTTLVAIIKQSRRREEATSDESAENDKWAKKGGGTCSS